MMLKVVNQAVSANSLAEQRDERRAYPAAERSRGLVPREAVMDNSKALNPVRSAANAKLRSQWNCAPRATTIVIAILAGAHARA